MVKCPNMNKFRCYVVAIVLSCVLSVGAQTTVKPAWVTTQPKPKGTIVGIANVSTLSGDDDALFSNSLFKMQLSENEYKSAARRLALKKIMGSLHLSVSQESLFGRVRRLSAFGNVNLDSVLVSSFIERVMDNPVITLSGEWSDSEEYWCYYSVKETAFQAYFQAFEDSVRNSAQSLWLKGRDFQESGEIYKAACSFAQALDIITPLFYKELIVSFDGKEIDVAKAIYDSYMHVYDGIELKPSVDVIPVVKGEGVPYTFWMTATRNGVKLHDIPMVPKFSGVVNAQPKTDDYGLCHFKIESAAAQQKPEDIVFSIDAEGLLDVPETFATGAFRGREFPDGKVRVEPFDPIVSIYLDVTPPDTSVVMSLGNLLLSRNDFRLTGSGADADVVLTVSLGNRLEKESVSEGKIGISQYSGAVNLAFYSVEMDSLFFKYNIDDFQVMVPSSKTLGKASKVVYREMARRMSRELEMPFKSLVYDKRKIMWRKLE